MEWIRRKASDWWPTKSFARVPGMAVFDEKISLRNAILLYDLETVKKIDWSAWHINEVDKDGNAFHVLLTRPTKPKNLLEFLKYLFALGVDINGTNREKYTPLMLAVQQNLSDAVKFLLNSRADITKKGNLDMTAALYAAQAGNLEILKILVNHGTFRGIQWDDTGSNLNILFHAIRSGNLKAVKWLLKKKASLINFQVSGFTPFLISCHYNEIEIAKYFAERQGSMVFQQISTKKSTALHIAGANETLELAQWLADNGVSATRKNTDEATPIVISATKGNIPIIKLLLKLGCSVKDHNQRKVTPLIAAANNGQLELTKWLLENGSDMSEMTVDGANPLLVCSYSGQLEMIKYFIENKLASVNDTNKYGGTPLLVSCCEGKTECVDFYLQSGADVHAQDNAGFTPIYKACQYGHLGCVELCLVAGASLFQASNSGGTCIQIMVKENHGKILEWLINYGALSFEEVQEEFLKQNKLKELANLVDTWKQKRLPKRAN